MIRLLVLFAVVTTGAILAVIFTFGLNDRSPGEAGSIGEFYSTELQDLGPGTMLHTIFIEYRRHGSLDESMQDLEDYRPETVYVEGWIEFDNDGSLVSMRGETRGADGTIYQTSHSEGDDMVFEHPDGSESQRLAGVLSGMTVDGYKALLEEGYAEGVLVVDERPEGTRLEVLRGQDVLVLETTRPKEPSSFKPGPGVTGYVLPYDGDLEVVQEVTRRYMSADEKRELLYERVVLDAAGTETVIESSEEILVEVLRP